MLNQVLELISRSLVVPLAEISSVDEALQVARLLSSFGHQVVEIPLRHPMALESIGQISRSGLIKVAAGTVVSPKQVEEVLGAGAVFAVSPSFRQETLSEALMQGLPYLPGIATPTEAHQALDGGATVLKVFPVHTLGGVKFIEALSSVFPTAKFMPSGGVSGSNASDYLSVDSVIAVSGSWLTPRRLISQGDWDGITSLLEHHQRESQGQ